MDKEYTRQKIKELRAMVAETDRIAIVLQDDPDPDAMASAMASSSEPSASSKDTDVRLVPTQASGGKCSRISQ